MSSTIQRVRFSQTSKASERVILDFFKNAEIISSRLYFELLDKTDIVSIENNRRLISLNRNVEGRFWIYIFTSKLAPAESSEKISSISVMACMYVSFTSCVHSRKLENKIEIEKINREDLYISIGELFDISFLNLFVCFIRIHPNFSLFVLVTEPFTHNTNLFPTISGS